jgi:hypothetical protein
MRTAFTHDIGFLLPKPMKSAKNADASSRVIQVLLAPDGGLPYTKSLSEWLTRVIHESAAI